MKSKSLNSSSNHAVQGNGGETHQIQQNENKALTTNQGVVVSDNQNSLKIDERGPTLLEDFILREKITHFDHERIPERIVHARGSGAYGVFSPYEDLSHLTKAAFLRNPKIETPVFVRFSTVAGGAGSGDMPRDVRGFAVKFYTEEGNFDLVGNNIPVFFIQDAIKFPDLIHSVKMEPDRGFPQSASAHDTFWDFVSLMPESMHMIMWAMSDRALPRSYRMMEGFGIHSFRFINEKNESNFVKFHWRPLLQSSSVLWDEAVKINGADSDFHRRDLWNSIEQGTFPEYEFSVQIISEEQANTLPFDILDSTKLIPEEVIPLKPIGKLTLNRNPDNFFAETEQVAFHPGHVVPGIDFSNDPLLQGRLHSYLDTQLSRLGGPNFHEIPVNRPRCPIHNFQRDGIARMHVPKGRVSYEPNSLDPSGPRENPDKGFRSFEEKNSGKKMRIRTDSFKDHYSQARLFYHSNTVIEQKHIHEALAFELSKVETLQIRKRVLGHLSLIDEHLVESVEVLMGMENEREKIEPATPPINISPSPSLSLLNKFIPTVKGRKLGILLGDGFNEKIFTDLKDIFLKQDCMVEIVSKNISGAKSSKDKKVPSDHTFSGGPSVVFDYLAVLASKSSYEIIKKDVAFKNWVSDGYNHLKVIGVNLENQTLEVPGDNLAGIVTLSNKNEIEEFLELAKQGRVWDRL